MFSDHFFKHHPTSPLTSFPFFSRHLHPEHHQRCSLCRSHLTLLPHSVLTASQVRKEQHDGSSSTSLISVSAHEDPLSLASLASSSQGVVVSSSSTFEWDKDDDELLTMPALTPVLSPPPVPQPSSSSSYHHHPTRTANASLTFFDKFAQDAKRNSEIRRKGLVDELLKYEDEPLYFLHDEKDNNSAQKQQNEEHHHHHDLPPKNFDDNDKHDKHSIISDPELETSQRSSSPLPIDTFMHDLDHEYFSSGHLVDTTNTHDDTDNDKTEQHLSDNSSHTRRSPSMPSPATLAPPIMDSNISTSSKTTSSAFSARWMSNLLKTGSGTGHLHQQHHQQGHGVVNTNFGINIC